MPRGVDLGADAPRRRRASPRRRPRRAALIGAPVPKRPPGFCVGCPERPVFSAIKLVERDLGKIHMAADIGCHTFSTLPPFNLGNTVLGYGLGLVERRRRSRPISASASSRSWATAASGITA